MPSRRRPPDAVAAAAFPALNVDVIAADLAVRIGPIDQNAEAIVREGVAEQQARVRLDLVLAASIRSPETEPANCSPG